MEKRYIITLREISFAKGKLLVQGSSPFDQCAFQSVSPGLAEEEAKTILKYKEAGKETVLRDLIAIKDLAKSLQVDLKKLVSENLIDFTTLLLKYKFLGWELLDEESNSYLREDLNSGVKIEDPVLNGNKLCFFVDDLASIWFMQWEVLGDMSCKKECVGKRPDADEFYELEGFI